MRGMILVSSHENPAFRTSHLSFNAALKVRFPIIQWIMAINIGQFIRLIKTFERDLFSFHAYIIYIFFQLTIFSIKDLLKIVVFIM